LVFALAAVCERLVDKDADIQGLGSAIVDPATVRRL
jgi:hypothetical protein